MFKDWWRFCGQVPSGEMGNGENGLVLVLHTGLGTGTWTLRKEKPTGVNGKKHFITDTVRPWVSVRLATAFR